MKSVAFGGTDSSISLIDAELVRIELEQPVGLARRTVNTRDYLFVEVHDTSGRRGLGFTYAGYDNTIGAMDELERLVAPLSLGAQWKSPAAAWDSLNQLHPAILDSPVSARALSALDIAFWDLWGKQRELPLRALIGNPGASKIISTYVGAGYYGAEKSNQQLQDELIDLRRRGYASIKVKVGRDSIRDERLRALASREAVGEDVALTFDANGAFAELATASQYLDAYAQARPSFIEDLLAPNLLHGYRELSSSSGVSLTCGEYLHRPTDWRFLLDCESIRLIQLDCTSCGGITAMMRLAEEAAEHGTLIDTHWFPELNLQFADCFSNLNQVEVFESIAAIPFADLVHTDGTFGHAIERKANGSYKKTSIAKRTLMHSAAR